MKSISFWRVPKAKRLPQPPFTAFLPFQWWSSRQQLWDVRCLSSWKRTFVTKTITKKENINANNCAISVGLTAISLTFLCTAVLCSHLFVVTDGRPLLCFVGRRRGRGRGGARRGLSNHRILPLPHPAVSSLQGKRLPWPLIIDFPLSFDHYRLFILIFSHWFIWVWIRFVINTHNTSEHNPKKDANANKHLADDNWSRLAVSTSNKTAESTKV